MGKILFIRGGAVGDFIVTMPAINLVRQSLPDVEIEILGYESIANLAVATGIADRVRSIEHASLAPFFAPGATLDQEMAAYFCDFDVVISYLYDPDRFFAGNLDRVGVETLIEGPFRMDETRAIPAARQLAEPLERLALFLDEPHLRLRFEGTANSPGKAVAIHPGSGSPSKNWSLEGWCQLCRLILGRFPDVEFLVISGEAEKATIGEFLSLLRRENLPYRHCEDLPLDVLAGRLQQSRLFLGHDSGIGHLAALTGIPGLVLFGPSDPRTWSPASPYFCHIEAPGKQMGNLKVSQLWNHPEFEQKLESLNDSR